MSDSTTANIAGDLAALWSDQYPTFKPSRDRIKLCGQWNRNEVDPVLPPGWENPGGFRVKLPHPTTIPQDVVSYVTRRQPAPERHPSSGGPRAGAIASDIERWLTAALTDRVQIDGQPLWETLCSFAVNDGEFAVIAQPCPSHWSGMLDLLDDNGAIKPAWQVDADGNDAEGWADVKADRVAFKPDKSKSTARYRQYVRDFKARRFPFTVRVLPAESVIPIGRDPESGRLAALLVRTQRSATSLRKQGFSFIASTPTSAGQTLASSAQTYELYELWTSDGDGCRVAYQITGLSGERMQITQYQGAEQAVVDLTADYGIIDLPVGYFYGWRRHHETDPNRKGIPLLWPFLGLFLGVNQMATSSVAHSFNTGFGGFGIKMDQNLYQVWVEMGRPTTLDIKPMQTQILLGEPFPLVHPGSGNEPNALMEMLIGLVERFNQSDAIKSNPDQSGVAQSVTAASVDTILNQVSGGARDAYRFIAMCLLEQAATLSERTGDAVPVYAHTDDQGHQQDHVEINAEKLGGDFAVDIVFPEKRGQNLPKAQAGVAWVERGLVGEAEWRQDFYGDPQPEQAMDAIAVERYMKTPQVDQQVMELVALIRGDRAMLKKQQLAQHGQLSAGGLPAALLPGRPGGDPNQQQQQQAPVGPDGVPTSQNVNPAAGALGGMMAGAMGNGPQQNIIQQTGQPAETAAP